MALVTCKYCGTHNRVGELPRGQIGICGNCKRELGNNKRPGKLSETAWAWIAIFGIVLAAFYVKRPRPEPEKKPNEPTWVQSRPTNHQPIEYPSPSRKSVKTSPPPLVINTQLPPPPVLTEQILPPHGEVTWYRKGDPIAPLEIRSSKGSHYVVKLSDYYSGRAVLSVFVHGGRTVNLDVPLGTYHIKYASGEHWYGPDFLFGPDTAYSKADSSFDFHVTGNQISGYTVTLYTVVNGNLQTSKISASEF